MEYVLKPSAHIIKHTDTWQKQLLPSCHHLSVVLRESEKSIAAPFTKSMAIWPVHPLSSSPPPLLSPQMPFDSYLCCAHARPPSKPLKSSAARSSWQGFGLISTVLPRSKLKLRQSGLYKPFFSAFFSFYLFDSLLLKGKRGNWRAFVAENGIRVNDPEHPVGTLHIKAIYVPTALTAYSDLLFIQCLTVRKNKYGALKGSSILVLCVEWLLNAQRYTFKLPDFNRKP